MNIDFVYNTDFKLDNEAEISSWITAFCQTENTSVDSLVFAFFSDEDLKTLNIKHLSHDYYTDVISFDESKNNALNGNIAISVERVVEASVEKEDSELVSTPLHAVKKRHVNIVELKKLLRRICILLLIKLLSTVS